MRKLVRVEIEYLDSDGTAVKVIGKVGAQFSTVGITDKLRIQRGPNYLSLYRTLTNGRLVVSDIPRERIVDIYREYAAEESLCKTA